MELRRRKGMDGTLAAKGEKESECRKRRRTIEAEEDDGCGGWGGENLRSAIEGAEGDDSSGTEYEPEDEVDGDSESNVSLVSEDDEEEGFAAHIEGDEGQGGSGEGGRRSGEGCSAWGAPCEPWGKAGRGVRQVHRPGTGEEVIDVVLRSRCTMKTVVGVNERLTVKQREAVQATALYPCLEYPDVGMERHLTLALIRCWVPRWKAFRIGGRRVSFSVFDVALLSGLPATGRRVELDGEERSSEVGEMVRARMAEWEREGMVSRLPGKSGKKRRFFRNYVSAMVALCEENNEEERLGLWLRMYLFMIMSGVLFPRTPYGAAWGMLQYVDDVEGLGQYNWAEAVWRVVVDTIEETQQKLCSGPWTEVQLNGFCLLIQVSLK